MARKREEKANKESRKTPKSRSPSESSCHDKNFHSLKHQLSAMKLTLREIPGDGNCLFGALADQLDGTPNTHMKHRQGVVTYMRNHREDFEPFVEDDEPFEKHLSNLAELGTYGGNECIVAFARLNGVKVMIHQLNAPLWQIDGSNGKENAKELHISYHNGDHYNSVRRTGDCTSNPSNLKLSVSKSGRAEGVAKKKIGKSPFDEGKGIAPYYFVDDVDPYTAADNQGIMACTSDPSSIQNCRQIMERTECQDLDTIRQFLVANEYDVNDTSDALLQYIIHEHKGEDQTTTSYDHDQSDSEYHSRDVSVEPLIPVGTSQKDRKKTQVELCQEKLKNPTLSNAKKKELRKQIRKQQRQEKKRSQTQNENCSDENACWGGSEDHSETIIVRDIGCLSI